MVTDPRYGELVAGAPLAYVSDYLSFVGADERGPVAFALDTNRGRDDDRPPGARLQADHGYAVLHDAAGGWVPLRGAERYPHPGPAVDDLPSSSWFAFSGDLAGGLVADSPANGLRLEVAPLVDRLVGRDGTTLFAMRTAAAVLRWDERTLHGRVIHEGLAMREANLLTRRSFSGLASLEFLYLAVGSPQAAAGDLYLQLVDGDRAPAGLPPQTGFASAPGAPADALVDLRDVRITTTRRVPAPGLHRWPSRWRAAWSTAGPDALLPRGRVELRTVSRRPVARWGLAGLAMSVVEGDLALPDGTTLPLHGFAEVLTLGPLLRTLIR